MRSQSSSETRRILLPTVGFGVAVYTGFALITPQSREVIVDNIRRAAGQ